MTAGPPPRLSKRREHREFPGTAGYGPGKIAWMASRRVGESIEDYRKRAAAIAMARRLARKADALNAAARELKRHPGAKRQRNPAEAPPAPVDEPLDEPADAPAGPPVVLESGVPGILHDADHAIARCFRVIDDETRCKNPKDVDAYRLHKLSGALEKLLACYTLAGRLASSETLRQITDLVEPELSDDTLRKLIEIVDGVEGIPAR